MISHTVFQREFLPYSAKITCLGGAMKAKLPKSIYPGRSPPHSIHNDSTHAPDHITKEDFIPAEHHAEFFESLRVCPTINIPKKLTFSSWGILSRPFSGDNSADNKQNPTQTSIACSYATLWCLYCACICVCMFSRLTCIFSVIKEIIGDPVDGIY